MPEVSYVGSGAIMARAMQALAAATNQAGEHFIGVAMADTPVDTGTLRASETMDGARASGSSVTVKVHTSGEANEYAFYRHEGTSRMAGVPFFQGPLLSYRPVYSEFIRRAVAAVF